MNREDDLAGTVMWAEVQQLRAEVERLRGELERAIAVACSVSNDAEAALREAGFEPS
jgi:hypothetical protein